MLNNQLRSFYIQRKLRCNSLEDTLMVLRINIRFLSGVRRGMRRSKCVIMFQKINNKAKIHCIYNRIRYNRNILKRQINKEKKK